MRERLLPALATAAALGIPMLILQRYVAETRSSAIALVAIWVALVGVVIVVLVRRRPGLRAALAGTWLAVLAGTLVVGYWTGFRDSEVMEDVAMASVRASGTERDRALSGEGDSEADSRAAAAEPVELASGSFEGADGHAGTGEATVVEQPGGDRLLTFTEFDVDPGVDVDVYLTPSAESVDDRVELGGLKGNVGDQQYEIPAETDLERYSNVVLWCNPFTVRIAVAALDV